MEAWGLAVLRVVVGVVFVAHGVPKLIPVWGGSPSATAAFFESLGLVPGYPLALAVGAVEVGGGAALVAGFYSTWAAAALTVDMAVAVWKAHLPHGFFLNWTLTQGVGHGYEFNLVLIAALVCVILAGPGALSIDGRRARFAESAAAGRARVLKSRA